MPESDATEKNTTTPTNGPSSQPSKRLRFVDAWLLPFAVAMFVVTIYRAEIIASPPYWDSAMGLFVEADYLAQSNFDYRRLALEEKSFVNGGPAVYITSIMPTLLALLMRIAPHPTLMLVIAHLATFACAAAIFVMAYGVLEPRIGSGGALLAGLALLTTPLYVVQIDMIGMELPMIAFGMLALLLLSRQKFAAAALATLGAFCVKMSGGLLTAALLLYLGLLVTTGLRHMEARLLRKCWLGLGACALVLVFEIGTFAWLNNLPNRTFEAYEAGSFNLAAGLLMPLTLCPDIVILLFACCIGLGVLVTQRVRELSAAKREEQKDDAEPFREAVADNPPANFETNPESAASEEAETSSVTTLTQDADETEDEHAPSVSLNELVEPLHHSLRDDGASAYSWIVVLATFAALVISYTIPRYVALTVPFLYVLASLLLFRLVPNRRWAYGVLVVVIAVNVANRHGQLYPNVVAAEHRTGAFLERSLEYLDDHRANIEAVRLVAEKHASVPVVAGNPFVHFLGMPNLGYVEKPLHGYAINSFVPPSFRPVERILDDCPEEAVIFSANNRFASPQTALSRVPLPDEDDDRIYTDESLTDSPLIVFRKTWPDESCEEIAAEYRSLLWPGRHLALQAEALAEQGRLEEAEALFVQGVELQPTDAETRSKLASFLVRTGRLEEAREQFESAISSAPERADLHHQLGAVLTELERYGAAIEALERALSLNPDNRAEIYSDLGVAYSRLDQTAAGIDRFRLALEANPNFARAHYLWAQVLVQQEHFEEALEHLRAAAELKPKDPGIVMQMAGLYLKLAQPDQAELAIQKLLSISPDNDTAHMQLAALYEEQGRLVDALRHYRRALRVNNNNHAAANNAAWLLAKNADPSLGSGAEAVQLATYANQKTEYKIAAYLDTLAAAHADAGEFDKAASNAESAIALAESQGEFELAQQITRRLSLYRDEKPFRGFDQEPNETPAESSER